MWGSVRITSDAGARSSLKELLRIQQSKNTSARAGAVNVVHSLTSDDDDDSGCSYSKHGGDDDAVVTVELKLLKICFMSPPPRKTRLLISWGISLSLSFCALVVAFDEVNMIFQIKHKKNRS